MLSERLCQMFLLPRKPEPPQLPPDTVAAINEAFARTEAQSLPTMVCSKSISGEGDKPSNGATCSAPANPGVDIAKLKADLISHADQAMKVMQNHANKVVSLLQQMDRCDANKFSSIMHGHSRSHTAISAVSEKIVAANKKLESLDEITRRVTNIEASLETLTRQQTASENLLGKMVDAISNIASMLDKIEKHMRDQPQQPMPIVPAGPAVVGPWPKPTTTGPTVYPYMAGYPFGGTASSTSSWSKTASQPSSAAQDYTGQEATSATHGKFATAGNYVEHGYSPVDAFGATMARRQARLQKPSAEDLTSHDS